MEVDYGKKIIIKGKTNSLICILLCLIIMFLAPEIINGHPFYVPQPCHRYHDIFLWNQILHGKVKLVKTDGSAAIIPVF